MGINRNFALNESNVDGSRRERGRLFQVEGTQTGGLEVGGGGHPKVELVCGSQKTVDTYNSTGVSYRVHSSYGAT